MKLRVIFFVCIFLFLIFVSPGFAEIIIDTSNVNNYGNYSNSANQIIDKLNNSQYANYSNKNQQTEVDFYSYMTDLDNRIKQNWHAKMLSNPYRIVVLLKISKDGRLLASNILLSSNNQEADASAIQAIRNTAIYPLPKEYNKDSIEVKFTFAYNLNGVNPNAQYFNRSELKTNDRQIKYQTYDEWYKEHKKTRKNKNKR